MGKTNNLVVVSCFHTLGLRRCEDKLCNNSILKLKYNRNCFHWTEHNGLWSVLTVWR